MLESVVFESGGVELPGDLSRPDASPLGSAVVLCHASGTRWATDSQMADWLSNHGHTVLTFDWRGCLGGESPRQLLPEQVVEDLVAAVTYLSSRVDVDPRRVGMLGRGLGGGFALAAAAVDDRIAATICLSGFGDFARRTALVAGVEHWECLRDRVEASFAAHDPVCFPANEVLASGTLFAQVVGVSISPWRRSR